MEGTYADAGVVALGMGILPPTMVTAMAGTAPTQVTVSPVLNQPAVTAESEPFRDLLQLIVEKLDGLANKETGDTVVNDLSSALNLDWSYVHRLLRMTLLAPDIVEAIIDGREPDGLTLSTLRGSLPLAWVEQRELVNGIST